mgnify:CR=1 FL=1
MTSIFSNLFDPFSAGLNMGLAILALLMGLISLAFGRRIYWAFVAVAGFLLGLVLGPLLFSEVAPSWQPWLTLLLALAFAGLSLVLHKFMIAISGAIGLGTLVYLLTQPNLPEWAVITLTIVAGVIGLIIAWALFDWGLMIFSAMAGASLMTSGLVSLFPATSGADWIIFLFLFVVGLTFQIIQWTRERTMKEAASRETEVRQQTVVVEEEENPKESDEDSSD